MWRIKSNGVDVTNTFIEAITKEHQQAVRVTFLDLQFRQVSDYGQLDSCFCNDANKNVSNFISDGNIDVDTERLIRRTAELTILNPTNQFTPRRSTDTDTDDNPAVDKSLAGYIYLNRYVRIERGVHLPNKQHIYAPVGTFMIDVAEIIAERNMTVVNLTLSDLFKRASKSIFRTTKKYDAGTKYNVIIDDLLNDSGLAGDRFRGSMDSLSERPDASTKISKALKFERGDNRGDKLKELCDKWDIDIYFNPMGKVVTEDKRSDKVLSKNSVFTFSTSLERKPREGMIVSLRRSLSDDNLFNRLIVVGTQNDKSPVVVEKANTNQKTRTSISQLGDRTKYLETSRASTTEEANKILEKQWKKNSQLEETVSIDCICVPILEGNDVISIIDTLYTGIGTEKKTSSAGKPYRLKRFNVPLVTSRQQIEVTDTVGTDEL